MVDTAKEPEQMEEIPEKSPKKKGESKKNISTNGSMRLMSLGVYQANTKREDITDVLLAGFRVWMKIEKGEPLRSRTRNQWGKLLNEYLKS